MRLVLAMAAMFMLAGCNVAVSTTPLFTAADEAGAPRLKAGVWNLEQADCTFDETKSVPQWPDCAGGAVVKSGEIVGYDQKRIIQIRLIGESVGEGPKKAEPYGYAAARPTKRDSSGAITAIHYWVVQCGPPAPPAKGGKPPSLGTLHPLRGMAMKPGDAMCIAASAGAIRAAAKPSEAWADKTMDAHWVRAGDN